MRERGENGVGEQTPEGEGGWGMRMMVTMVTLRMLVTMTATNLIMLITVIDRI